MDYKLPQRFEISNKSTYGRVLNIAGSDYMSGAAYLSSVSALKVGCGYCFLSSTQKCIDAVAAQTQNVVFVPLSNLNDYLTTVDVIEIGCGLSQDDNAINIFKNVLLNSNTETPIIIDADGLNILANYKEFFLARGFRNVVITPHPKEASRLLRVSVDEILSDEEKYAKMLANEFKVTTVLKTNKTTVVGQNGEIYKNTTGNNSMAKAGSGDVLTGMIAGFVAQGKSIYEAAVLAVYIHGLSGDIARDELTEYCVMASDLIDYIPKAIKRIN